MSEGNATTVDITEDESGHSVKIGATGGTVASQVVADDNNRGIGFPTVVSVIVFGLQTNRNQCYFIDINC